MRESNEYMYSRSDIYYRERNTWTLYYLLLNGINKYLVMNKPYTLYFKRHTKGYKYGIYTDSENPYATYYKC
jgi:hypothetical protein